MNFLFYILARACLGFLELLPLRWIVWLGRQGGLAAYYLDKRHRRVARENLAACFGTEKTAAEIHALARENFARIGENFAAAVKTATLSTEAIHRCVEVHGGEDFTRTAGRTGNVIVAIGHFGNFELYARVASFFPGRQSATTYRSLPNAGLNRVFQELRERSGCLYFERRTHAKQLVKALGQQNVMLGLLVDQHAGDRGLPVPFFGRICSTSTAAAVYALRFQCPLHAAICYRTAPGRWRVEVSPAIPTTHNGQPRSTLDICTDINRAYEAAIRRDPANWFWVHRRWKPVKRALPPGIPASPPAPAPDMPDSRPDP